MTACRPPTPAGVVSAAAVRYKTDDRVGSNIVTAAQVAMLGVPASFDLIMLSQSLFVQECCMKHAA